MIGQDFKSAAKVCFKEASAVAFQTDEGDGVVNDFYTAWRSL